MNCGYEVVVTREPGGNDLSEKIRELLLHYDGDVSDRCESFLFLAGRAQNVDMTVKPAIEKGEIVLCDRHIDSTIAYQGYGRGGDIEHLKKLNSLATGAFYPDLTFVFDVDVETSQKRVGKEQDRMESAGREFFEKVRKGYIEISKTEPNRVKLINSMDTIENIFEQVKKYVEEAI